MNPFKWFKSLFQPDPPFKQGYEMASRALLNCPPEDEWHVIDHLRKLCRYTHCHVKDSEYYEGILQAIKDWRG